MARQSFREPPNETASRGRVEMRLAVPVVTILLLSAAPAGAGERTETFAGTCAMTGEVVHDPPITTVPAPAAAAAEATGTCSGTLTDHRGHTRELDAVRATYAGRASGTIGCVGGSATGAGVLRIRGARIAFAFSEVRGPGAAAVQLEGADGGSATGAAAA